MFAAVPGMIFGVVCALRVTGVCDGYVAVGCDAVCASTAGGGVVSSTALCVAYIACVAVFTDSAMFCCYF